MDEQGTAAPWPGVEENRRAMESLRYCCAKLMEVASRVLVLVASTETKLQLSSDVWVLAQAAEELGGRLTGLRSSSTEGELPPSAGYVDFLRATIALPEPDDQLAVLRELAYPELRAAIARHRACLHASADEYSVSSLDRTLQTLWTLPEPDGRKHAELAPLQTLLHVSGGASGSAEPPCPEAPAALSAIPRRPGRATDLAEPRRDDPEQADPSLAAALHDVMFRIELPAAEICSAIIAYHPEAPWGLRYDMAKQVRDEARHFELLASRLRELGGAEGDHPISFEVWDKFTLGRSLAERIVIEQRLGEGLGLDGGLQVYTWMREHGDDRTALLFDYINADEVTHVGNGNRWLKQLLGDESEVAALDAYVRALLSEHGWPVRHTIPINTEHRALAGFSAAELAELQACWERERR